MTELALLGTLAQKTGKVLEWDSKAMQVTNEKEVNQFLNPEYRKPWALPA
jgi:hypothetical protein